MCSSVLSLAQAMDVSIRSLEEEEGKKDADGLTIGGITENFAKGVCKFFQFYRIDVLLFDNFWRRQQGGPVM